MFSRHDERGPGDGRKLAAHVEVADRFGRSREALRRRAEQLLKQLPPKSDGVEERITYLEQKISIQSDLTTALPEDEPE